jgi:hypothetical protein
VRNKIKTKTNGPSQGLSSGLSITLDLKRGLRKTLKCRHNDYLRWFCFITYGPSVFFKPQVNSSEKIAATSTSATASVAKKTVSPFNIVANTNKILNSIQNLIYGGRMRPSAAMQKYGLSSSVASNDKSMVNLIVMGLKLNETTAR